MCVCVCLKYVWAPFDHLAMDLYNVPGSQWFGQDRGYGWLLTIVGSMMIFSRNSYLGIIPFIGFVLSFWLMYMEAISIPLKLLGSHIFTDGMISDLTSFKNKVFGTTKQS